MTQEIKDVVGRIYENFLMRDLTYVFGGSLLLASIKYAYDGNLIVAINDISENFLTFIIFIAISYFIGLIVQEGLSFVKICKINIVKTTVEVPAPYNDYFLCMADIQENYGEDTIRRIERIIYLKHIGAAVGSASFISSLILLLPLIKYHRIADIILFSVMVVLTIICLMENKEKLKQQNETLKHFANKINVRE